MAIFLKSSQQMCPAFISSFPLRPQSSPELKAQTTRKDARAAHLRITPNHPHRVHLRACSSASCSEPAEPKSQSAKPIRSILNVATNLFPLWVLSAALAAFLHPPTFLWFRSAYIVPTLALIMLGMGLTIAPSSFTEIARDPRPILTGVAAQYTLMPLLATLISRLLALPAPLAAGVILVGVCPGGAASNVVCLLAGASVPLSVVLTLLSTFASIALIPFLMKLLAGSLVPVNPFALLWSTAQVVLLPLLLGSFLNCTWPRAVNSVMSVLPLVSVLGVTLICAGVVAANAPLVASIGPRLILAISSMHALGGLFGYLIALLLRFPKEKRRTICIEVLMQNSSLAVSLANAHFANPLTAVPGAISATMHSVFGSVVAACWRIADGRKRKQSANSP